MSEKMVGFDPAVAKLISAFALAVQRIGLEDKLAQALFQTALEIYNGTEARRSAERYDA